jgi:hypothetical protein
LRTTAGSTVLVLSVVLGSAAACYPAIHSTLKGELTPELRSQLWIDPGTERDLFWGVGGRRLAPDADAPYKVIEVKQGGFSSGLTVTGPQGREWSAKFPPEAPTEVVASRIVWGVGYHQPPIYYVERWSAEGAPDANPQQPARFREKKPDLHGLDAGDSWSYYQNPFVDTPELNGLLVLQVMLGNSDLKDQQNVVYKLSDAFEGARTWYVARDLGQSFGRTGVFNAPRGDIEAFEQTPFIVGMLGRYVRFDYRGRHAPLIDHMTPADVRWICERLERLTDHQWQEAFRAGGYDRPLADRFIRRMKQKIREGLSLRADRGEQS